MNPPRTIVAGALGECVHVAGVLNFLHLAEAAGWHTVFLGPAVSTERLLRAAREHRADLVGVSYRLTPETGERLLAEFAEEAADLHAGGMRFAFGGTPPLAELARHLAGFFDAVFDGSHTREEVLAYLRGETPAKQAEVIFPQTALERIAWKSPYPLLRHHFGLPTLPDTLAGIARIAEARVLDVISLGLDQDAQENFFHPERQDARRTGAGGVPVRTPADYEALYAASRRGNYPLLRAYCGTDDFIALAEVQTATIHNAWCAVPLFWFNQMDGRGPWDLEGSIRQHQGVMRWYGERNWPVELNEPHHWGLRDAPDVLFVVSAYLSAHNAKAFGVADYIAQMMFNSPPAHSDVMDLAKMLACLEICAPLEDASFHLWRQTRLGLLSHPLDEEAARGHLAASTYLQMALQPHIVHVVAHTEAHHAANAEDVLAACRVAQRAIDNALRGAPAMLQDERVQARKAELLAEAQITLDALRRLNPAAAGDPLTDPATLARGVSAGILDAPHLKNNPFGRGAIATRVDALGACRTIDPDTGAFLSEEARLARLPALA